MLTDSGIADHQYRHTEPSNNPCNKPLSVIHAPDYCLSAHLIACGPVGGPTSENGIPTPGTHPGTLTRSGLPQVLHIHAVATRLAMTPPRPGLVPLPRRASGTGSKPQYPNAGSALLLLNLEPPRVVVVLLLIL